jgi:putative acetyltransferase
MSGSSSSTQPPLRPYRCSDLPALLALYANAVRSQCAACYSPQQVHAWSNYAQQQQAVAAAIGRGTTLVSPVAQGDGRLAAFGVLDPIDRLALLYCDGPWSRQGRASALLAALSAHAQSQGVVRLRTEASQLSRPLLLRHGWQLEAEETVLFAGVSFVRWRMIKSLPS